MTRKKVKLAFVMNDNARKASLKKRRLGLTKKVNELTILCDVRACLIIYNPDEAEPLVWPSPELARGLIERFFALPEIERSKKRMNQETYLKERLGKASELLAKSQKKNKDFRMDHIMFQLHGGGRKIDDLGLNEMYGLIWFSRERIGDIKKRMEFIQHIPPRQANHLSVEQAADGETRVGLNNHSLPNLPDQYLMDQWFFGNYNNNNGAPIADNPNDHHSHKGLMPLQRNSHYGNHRDIGLSYHYENCLGSQANTNPNVEMGLMNAPHHGSVTNLVLELTPYHHDSNLNMNVNEGNMNIGSGRHMGLGLGLESRHGLTGSDLGLQLPRGSRESGLMGANLGLQQPYVHGGEGGGSSTGLLGVANLGELGIPVGHFGGGDRGGGGDIGLNYDVSKTWPDNTNFSL